MTHKDAFEPKLVFFREADITTLDSTDEWRQAVREKCREAGGSLRKLWLSQARPLRMPIVSWREFQTFHARLGLPYGVEEMMTLGDYIDSKLPLASSEQAVTVRPQLIPEHGRGPHGQQSRLVLRLGSTALQENRFIRAATQDFYHVPGSTDEAWGGTPPDVLLAHTFHGHAQEVINTIKKVLKADPDLLVPEATLGPLYYEDNSDELLAAATPRPNVERP
jgi:hypothetical protein